MQAETCKRTFDEWGEAASHITRYARQIRADAEEICSEHARLTVVSLKQDLLHHRRPNLEGAYKGYKALIGRYRPSAYKAIRECKGCYSNEQMQSMRDWTTRVDEDLKLVNNAVNAVRKLG